MKKCRDKMKIDTKHFYLAIDRDGFTIAILGKHIDIDLSFCFLMFDDSGLRIEKGSK